MIEGSTFGQPGRHDLSSYTKMTSTRDSTKTLPRTSRKLDTNARTTTKKQLPSLSESPSTEAVTMKQLDGVSSHDLAAKYNIKRITSWFKTWRAWQKRVFTCRVMEHCSKQHLELLATSLEPILHFDFSSSLSAPLQSLHLDSVATFQVHRSILQNVNPRVLDAKQSLSNFTSTVSSLDLSMVPSTRDTAELSKQCSQKQRQIHHKVDDYYQPSTMKVSPTNDIKINVTNSNSSTKANVTGREAIVPSLPLIHVKHAQTLNSQRPSATSMEDLVTLQRNRFSSIPDFKSTTDLLRNIRRQKEEFGANKRRRRHKKSNTVGTYHILIKSNGEERRQAELFKEQLAIASNVS